MTGYTFSYWWIFQKYETLWKVGLYTGCVWGTHDPVVGVAFIVVTIMCGCVWHYVSNYFGIVLVFFWYHVWHYVWYYRNFQGICFSFIRHPKPLYVKVWNHHPAKHGSNCVKIFLIWSWWLIDCAHQVSGRSLKAFLVKNTLKVPWKHLKHCQYPVPRKVVDGVLCQVPGKYLEST